MPDSGKTGWDKAAIVLQPVGGLLTALAVALVGILGSNYLERNRQEEAKHRQQAEAQDARLKLYTELMSRREQAYTALREDMFKSIVGTFLKAPTTELDQKVFSLELLAYNFHESLELAPLFKHLRREVEQSSKPPKEKAEYVKRLERAAQEVAGKQIEILHESGTSEENGLDLQDFPLMGKRVFDKCLPLHSEDSKPGNAAKRERCLFVDVIDKDMQAQALRIRLVSNTPEGESVDQLFWLDFYDLPMVDNTRLSHDQRFAVVLRRFSETGATLAFVYFPGSHAGLKDKPFYDEMLHQLELTSDGEGQAKEH